jgi:hypothetical protein
MTTNPYPRWVVRRVVRFAQTEADQALLQAVETALEQQFHGNFSALCKQALRQFLLPEQSQAPMSQTAATMQAQIEALQQQVARVERQMGDRIQRLEQREAGAVAEACAPERTEEPEVDPLLSRLAPLLEDF